MGVLPQTTPEQRAGFYEDTETLLMTGFLSHTISVCGIRIAFRSLGPGDLFLLRSRVGKGTDRDWRLWALAQSIWLMDGYVLLGNPNVVPRLVRTLAQLPRGAQEILSSIMMGLFARQTRALDAIEAYSYEIESRNKWVAYSGQLPGHRTGIPGAEHLGLNYVQQMWAFFNAFEDQRLKSENLWEGFKFATNPHAPKGVQKIDQRDQQVRRNERSRRQGVMDRFYYERVGVLTPRKKGEKQEVPEDKFFFQSKSVDELADEMHRWVTGQDDEHDKIVKAYKKHITERYENEEQEREARRQQLKEIQTQMENEVGPTRLVGYTPDQLEAIRPGLKDKMRGARVVYDGPPQRDYLYSRYLERTEEPGLLESRDGVLTSPEVPSDLLDMITDRQVPFDVREGEE